MAGLFILIVALLLAGCTTGGPDHAEAAPDFPAAPTVLPTLPAPSPTPSPTPLPTPTPAVCSERSGKIVRGELVSAVLPEPLAYRIYLPPCYTASGGPGYPVLYLIHGLMLDDEQWDRIGADETADRLIAARQAPPFIIVMPYDRRATDPSTDLFGQALTDELVPWVDAHFHTRAERQFRAIGGLSRGAGWAIHLGFSRWDLFGSVGAHSLALFYEDSLLIDDWLADIPEGQAPRAYLDIGRGDDELEGVSEFEAYLTRAAVPHEWHLNKGLHEDAYWSAHVEQYLRWYAAVWGG